MHTQEAKACPASCRSAATRATTCRAVPKIQGSTSLPALCLGYRSRFRRDRRGATRSDSPSKARCNLFGGVPASSLCPATSLASAPASCPRWRFLTKAHQALASQCQKMFQVYPSVHCSFICSRNLHPQIFLPCSLYCTFSCFRSVETVLHNVFC